MSRDRDVLVVVGHNLYMLYAPSVLDCLPQQSVLPIPVIMSIIDVVFPCPEAVIGYVLDWNQRSPEPMSHNTWSLYKLDLQSPPPFDHRPLVKINGRILETAATMIVLRRMFAQYPVAYMVFANVSYIRHLPSNGCGR